VIVARLRALMRRSAAIASNQIERGSLEYNFGSRKLSVAGTEVVLTGREDQLLRRLLLANGACVSRQELLDDIWGVNSGINDTIVDVYLRKLRAKLHPCKIENLRSLGYRIVP